MVNFAIWYGRFLKTTCMYVSAINMFKVLRYANAITTLVNYTPGEILRVDVIMNAWDVGEGGEHVGHRRAWVRFYAMRV